jgi:hypothetical protein
MQRPLQDPFANVGNKVITSPQQILIFVDYLVGYLNAAGIIPDVKAFYDGFPEQLESRGTPSGVVEKGEYNV